MEAFITQFYLNRVPPSEIILSNDLPDIKVLNAFLTARANLKVHIIFPKRGEKKELISWAIKNAEEELIRKLSDILNQKQLIRGLQKKLNLNKYPSRIEVYDNSHFQGKHALGAMIVLGDEGYIKSQYRKYNFSEDIVKKGDDIAMMKEMLSRRFRKKYEKANNFDSKMGKTPHVSREMCIFNTGIEFLTKNAIENIVLRHQGCNLRWFSNIFEYFWKNV